MLLAFRAPADLSLVPDYARPDALCVPFWRFRIEATLRQVARRAARHVGVILIGPDRDLAESFIAQEPLGQRMVFVPGGFDTPWLRDHAPLAVEGPDGLRLFRPRRPETSRQHDAQLFAQILAAPSTETPIHIAGGNIVAGAHGLAVSTYDLVGENETDNAAIMAPVAEAFGVRHWILTPKFDDDISGHTDSMVRFLSPDLCAVCTRPDRPDLAGQIDTLVAELQEAAPGMEVLRIPAGTSGGVFCSSLNWIQLGRTVLVPHFPGDTAPGRAVAAALRAKSYRVVLIPCPTTELGGALHCLTASVFAE